MRKIDKATGPKTVWASLAIILVCAIMWASAYEYAHRSVIQVSQLVSATEAAPGERTELQLAANLRAALAMGCSVKISPFITDSDGIAHGYETGNTVDLPEEDIRRRVLINPDQLTILFKNPVFASPGPGAVDLMIASKCGVWHEIFGPRIEWHKQPFTILRR